MDTSDPNLICIGTVEIGERVLAARGNQYMRIHEMAGLRDSAGREGREGKRPEGNRKWAAKDRRIRWHLRKRPPGYYGSDTRAGRHRCCFRWPERNCRKTTTGHLQPSFEQNLSSAVPATTLAGRRNSPSNSNLPPFSQYFVPKLLPEA